TMFLLIAAAEGLVALGVPRAAAYLIVFGFLVLVVGILVLLGTRQVKKVKGPERTISETKETAAFLKNPTQYTSCRHDYFGRSLVRADTPPDDAIVLIDGPWTHRHVSANGIAL